MAAPALTDVEVGAISASSTQAELRSLHVEVRKLEVMLRQYSDGSARPDSPGRFSDDEITAQFTAVLGAAETAFNTVMPLNPVV